MKNIKDKFIFERGCFSLPYYYNLYKYPTNYNYWIETLTPKFIDTDWRKSVREYEYKQQKFNNNLELVLLLIGQSEWFDKIFVKFEYSIVWMRVCNSQKKCSKLLSFIYYELEEKYFDNLLFKWKREIKETELQFEKIAG